MRVIGRRYLGKNAAVLKRVIAMPVLPMSYVPEGKFPRKHEKRGHAEEEGRRTAAACASFGAPKRWLATDYCV